VCSSDLAEFLAKACEDYNDYLLLDFGKENSTLFVIQDRQIVYIRSFKSGPDRGKTVATNIHRTVLAFSEQEGVLFEPEILFVTGSGLKAPGTREILAQNTGLGVETAEFRESMEFELDERVADFWDDELYTGAMSLCYGGIYGSKGLKLRERYVAIGKYYSDYKEKILRRAVLLGLILLVFLFNTVLDSVMTGRKLKQYDKQMTAIYKEAFPSVTKIVDPYNELKAKVAEAKKRMAFADSNAGNVRVIDLLNDISKGIQDSVNVEFDRLVLSSEDLKISGTTDTYSTVDMVKSQLEKIGYVKSVVIASTTNEQNDKQVHFKLSVTFKGPQ
jgi:hypothetical protein